MRAKRIDGNQQEIVKALRKIGYSVFITSSVGQGFGDIVLGAHGRNFIFEIKDGKKHLSQQRLTNPESLFHAVWKGQIDVITSVDDAIDIINQYCLK